MKAFVAIPASLALVLSLAACDRAAGPAESNAAASAQGATADAQAVKQAFAAFNADIAAKKLDAIRAHYASDAVMILPGQKPFEGIDSIMTDYEGYVADPASKYVPGAETTEVSSDGDLAYGEVKYQTTFTNSTTKAVETSDRYNLTVYKKQQDGSWKVVRDVNVALPAAG
ncbi:MAG TPA: SgcJ/EcaC family oxidoreductase [Sphingomicrobium sp.]|nr:SgcJ/EcaC family oxidoreductase [Sphingomicrobium sp.]